MMHVLGLERGKVVLGLASRYSKMYSFSFLIKDVIVKNAFLAFFSLLLSCMSYGTDADSLPSGEKIRLQYGTELNNPKAVSGIAEATFSRLPLTGLSLQIGDREFLDDSGPIELPLGHYDVAVKYRNSILYKKEIHIKPGSRHIEAKTLCEYPEGVKKYITDYAYRDDIQFEYQIDESGSPESIEIINGKISNLVVKDQYQRLSKLKFCPWNRDGEPVGETRFRTVFEYFDKKQSKFRKEAVLKEDQPEKAFVFGLFANRAQIEDSMIDDFETGSFSELGFSVGYRKESAWQWLDKRWFWDTDFSFGLGFGSTRKVESLRCTSDFVTSEYCSMQLRQQIFSGSISMLAMHEFTNWRVLYGPGISYFNLRNRLLLNGSGSESEYDSVSATGVAPMLKVGVNNKKVEYSYAFIPVIGDDTTGSGPYHQFNVSFFAPR
ncbi:hypothetical protein NBRC116585_00780 [Thalassolituus maritimus]|uniref:PEGA domain-containing protein n=1 Tax=Thalassolituus maritimus TaxID=484498 RepID=A0ABP9ZV00_9GAMM